MDSDSISNDFNCQNPPNTGLPVNTLDCDSNNDGVNDLFASGNRSWLDLDGGGGGADQMKDWVRTGNSPLVSVESWVPSNSGVKDATFTAIEDYREGDIVTVPVFDEYCEGEPSSACKTSANVGDTVIPGSGSKQLYFHIVAFVPFKITCVAGDPKSTDCDGHNQLVSLNPKLKNSFKSVEGYFVKGYIPEMGACENNNFYTGAYTVQLRP